MIAQPTDDTTHRRQRPQMTQMKQMVWVGSSGNSLGVVPVKSVGAVRMRSHRPQMTPMKQMVGGVIRELSRRGFCEICGRGLREICGRGLCEICGRLLHERMARPRSE